MVVLLMGDPPLEPDEMREMLCGVGDPLTSAFRLRYHTLLQLYAMEGCKPESVVVKSFHAFQRRLSIPSIRLGRAELELALERARAAEAEAAQLLSPAQLTRILELREESKQLRRQAAARCLAPRHLMRFLQPGRLVWVVEGGGASGEGMGLVRGWAVLLGWRHQFHRPIDPLEDADRYVCDVLLPCAPGAAAGESPTPAALEAADAEASVLSVRLPCVRALSVVRLHLPSDLRDARNSYELLEALREACKRMGALGTGGSSEDGEKGVAGSSPGIVCPPKDGVNGATNGATNGVANGAVASGLGLKDETDGQQLPSVGVLPIEELVRDDEECAQLMLRVHALEGEATALSAQLAAELDATPAQGPAPAQGQAPAQGRALAPGRSASSSGASLIESRLRLLSHTRALSRRLDSSHASERSRCKTHEFEEQMSRMLSVLRQLGFVSAEGVVQLKGRAAAEVDASDELLVAELILNGIFNHLSPAAATALCSCLVAADMEKVKRAPPMPAELVEPFAAIRAMAAKLAKVYADAELATDQAAYVARFDGGMVSMLFAWCNGAPFSSLSSLCDLFEGSIIRAIRRVSELLDELKSAAKAIGNDELFDKFEEGCTLIRRDIVFANSLYVADG